MRKSLLTIVYFCIIFFAVSCKNESSEPLIFKNTDNSIEIVISGERMSSLDPWTMNIQLGLADTNVVHTSTEVYVDKFSKENISINWESESKAKLTVKERDGTVRTIPITVVK